MPVCWCGKRHGKGMKHWVLNWKLYWLRSKEESEKAEKEKK